MGRSARPEPLLPLVRPATAEDGYGLADLLDLLGYPCSAEEAAGRVLTLRDDPNQSLLVADVKGVVVGLVACDLSYYLPLGALTCRITALAVTGQAKRQGIGRLLLREAEALAREAGAVRVELTSATQRTDAHAFYAACGYTEGALRFVKRLGGA